MATLLSEIRSIVSGLSAPVRFEYATLEEANANVFDKLGAGEYPVCLVIPFDIKDSKRENGRINSETDVSLFMLTRVNAGTIDSDSYKIETTVIEQMRGLCREIVNALDKSDIVEEEGIAEVNNRSVHEAVMDAHLYGCWSEFKVKYSEDISTC